MPETVTIRGAKKVIRKLLKVGDEGVQALGVGLYVAGNDIMTLSKTRVPVDMGTLRGSGYVTEPTAGGRDAKGRFLAGGVKAVEVEMGYGGPAEDYAVAQHERTDYSHPEGGQAKFLETAADDSAGETLRTIAQYGRAAFRGRSAAAGSGANPKTPWEGS